MQLAPSSHRGTQGLAVFAGQVRELASFAGELGLALLLAAAPVAAGGDPQPTARPAPAAAGAAEAPSAAAEPPDACVDRAVNAIQRRYEEVRDLSADFTQRSISVSLGGAGGRAQESSGHVVFAKPGKMHWTYSKPQQSLVVSDGHTLWLYDPELSEVQKLAVGGGYFSGAAVQFLIGDGNLLRDFDVKSIDCADDAIQLELTPKEPATYEKLRVRTDPARGDLDATMVFDLLGNVTEVTFHGIQTNQDPAPEVFRFEPPEGVEVIELAPPSS